MAVICSDLLKNYQLALLNEHIYSYTNCFGAAVTPSGEVHVADRLGPGVTPFMAIALNNAGLSKKKKRKR